MKPVTTAQLRASATVDLMTAARALGLGRTKAYELARRDQFPCRVIRIGDTYRIPTLRHCWPDTAVEPLALDVTADADRMRPLFHDSALIACAADGVVPRRVVSHLARRAGIPAVLACVLEDGEIGEIIRLLPWPTAGCLICHRQYLADIGGFDPEPALDQPYGTGTDHRPMTAVAGDLQLVGQLAAKIAIATLLEHAGQYDQVLPGDHLVVGLRPHSGLPPHADLRHAAEFRWSRVGPPLPGCPTCDPESTGNADRPAGAAR